MMSRHAWRVLARSLRVLFVVLTYLDDGMFFHCVHEKRGVLQYDVGFGPCGHVPLRPHVFTPRWGGFGGSGCRLLLCGSSVGKAVGHSHFRVRRQKKIYCILQNAMYSFLRIWWPCHFARS